MGDIPDVGSSTGQAGAVSPPPPPPQQSQDVILAGLNSLAELFKFGGQTVTAANAKVDTLSAVTGDRPSVSTPSIISDPTLDPASPEATIAIANYLYIGKVGTALPEYNKFLGGLVGVALMAAIMEYMKTQQAGEKISSNMWVDIEKQTMELADSISQNIKDRAVAEAIGDICKAVLSAGTAAVSLGGFARASSKALSSTDFQKMQMLTTAINTILTGVTQNMIEAQLAIVKGNLDAQKTIMDTEKDISQSMMSKMEKAGDDFAKSYDSFQQALQGWLDKLSENANKLTPH